MSLCVRGCLKLWGEEAESQTCCCESGKGCAETVHAVLHLLLAGKVNVEGRTVFLLRPWLLALVGAEVLVTEAGGWAELSLPADAVEPMETPWQQVKARGFEGLSRMHAAMPCGCD